ncbi:uncharacterized protein LOC128676117 [Plodia interpunctella]|uniref:uncharacterized protein LOC128676117 n=1 Tax=Plodia interpunctella TaxID=58824 RepID=UPI002367D36A|nr:uncharacterized protein LOC128676117 [Plodia interpunctella]
MEDLDLKTLKEIYPQKYFYKLLCRCLYFFGCGDFWYEQKGKSTIKKNLYAFWAGLSNIYLVVVILNEFLAYTRTDLLEKEKNDLMQHTFAHPAVWSKIAILMFRKKRVMLVLKRFFEETRSIYSSNAIDKAALSKSFKYCFALGFVCWSTLCTAEIDGVRAHFKEGIPIRTEVTYFPTRSNSGVFINILRFFMDFHWFYLVAIMLIVDFLAISSLIFTEAKFKLLQLYFKDLEKLFNDKTKSKKEQDEDFKERFIEGIRLHEDALWSAKNIQSSLGSIYSIQIFESLSLLTICLIKLVTSERILVLLIANFAYIICVIVLTGTYMTAGGDITYEASRLSTAIFHCGWEICQKKSELRPLAVLAIQRSQVPVYMTAFDIIELSYVNYISVLRSSYSFFAVMY